MVPLESEKFPLSNDTTFVSWSEKKVLGQFGDMGVPKFCPGFKNIKIFFQRYIYGFKAKE